MQDEYGQNEDYFHGQQRERRLGRVLPGSSVFSGESCAGGDGAAACRLLSPETVGGRLGSPPSPTIDDL